MDGFVIVSQVEQTMPPIFVGPYLDHIQAAETLGDLKHFFAFAYRHAKALDDAEALAKIIAAKDQRKAELAEAAEAAPTVPAASAPAPLPYDLERLDFLRRQSLAASPPTPKPAKELF
jgi:hypothetical protein